ncbi:MULTISPECIES: hypothetical protein [Pseudomonas]|jgi:hypothetical protein|uniref:DUF1795 domain-containing protein n=1 Tax=Pseudomonas mercuritolerans TaxID=2951809 RepID=A0ABT2Y3R6_9PSED|nr:MULTISPECIES: hypothetical protein [Pseudomonas]MCV2225328.1 hypothetical protein [Pseudomonas mercuritolerans]
MKAANLLGNHWFSCALLVSACFTGNLVHAKEPESHPRVIMYYGPWSPEENRFDASRWFSSGMYRPRLMGTPPEESPVTMLRNRPESLRHIENDVLLTEALFAVERQFPKLDTEDLILNTPDLHRQIRYAYSSFAEPDRPVDSYWLFITFANKTVVVTIDWDVTEKKLLPRSMASNLIEKSDEEAAYLQVKKELDGTASAKR